ncbi:MAG TPA: hypothetical protein VFB86_01830, partial [Bacteroidales bacterium]|nr:hypothetical protein [Bacteroidales bacterium]
VLGIVIVRFITISRTMIRRGYTMITAIALLLGLFFSSCENQVNQEAGFLEGVVSIGPICPVETDPPDPGCLPTAETYKAYPVSIWTSNGRRKIAQINPALDGSYKTELDPGNYLVKLGTANNRIGSSNLPAEVTITSQNKTILFIDIDTGIR